MTEKCVHHYICEPGTILNCPAKCKKCGDERVYANDSVSQTYNPSMRRAAGSLNAARDFSGYGPKSRGQQN